MLAQFPEVPPVIIPSKRFPPINLVRKVVSFPELAKIMEERDKEVKYLPSAWYCLIETMLGALYT